MYNEKSVTKDVERKTWNERHGTIDVDQKTWNERLELLRKKLKAGVIRTMTNKHLASVTK